MRNPEELIRESAAPKDFVAVSWNLHKGRSPLGLQAWSAMQRWVQSTNADVYFLQEAMARRMPPPVLASEFRQSARRSARRCLALPGDRNRDRARTRRSRSGRTCSNHRGGMATRFFRRIRSILADAGTSPRIASKSAACWSRAQLSPGTRSRCCARILR